MLIAPVSSADARPRVGLSLQALVGRSAIVGMVIAGPVCLACVAMGRHDIAKGLVAGLLLGILNSLLLAQRLDRMISGVEGVERLNKVFGANRALRFTLVLGCSALATQIRGLHIVALVLGLGFFFVISTVVYSRGVLRRWRLEEGQAA